MKLIGIIIILLLHWYIIQKIANQFIKKIKFDIFKLHTILAPINILLTFIFIKFSNLSLKDAGFTIGNLKEGLISIFLIGLPAAVISAFFTSKTAKETFKEISYLLPDSKWKIIYMGILVGPVEETLYRGFLQGNLSTIIHGNLFIFNFSTILASIIFTFIHYLNTVNKAESLKVFLSMIPVRFVAALILGYSFQISRSLIYPIIIHNLIDGFNITALDKAKSR
ncbi:CPBP family intramembrane metalloprotease [Thermosipho ferrireducens]|uniref:CPBP family intramembrane metalloprotease n=1 Tax=Thermosipho ferrireducens TaxID=2571116 RepID=A0ABX7S8Y8_9BACT|nr:CPBP family intramembrane glutamic endopeptidase [Thermosipho ferrireducens]QTA38331.1 CPBP family intramembrane metalloprotease [Thermosipho ferrireducens]